MANEVTLEPVRRYHEASTTDKDVDAAVELLADSLKADFPSTRSRTSRSS